jgi:hypothetical protein
MNSPRRHYRPALKEEERGTSTHFRQTARLTTLIAIRWPSPNPPVTCPAAGSGALSTKTHEAGPGDAVVIADQPGSYGSVQAQTDDPRCPEAARCLEGCLRRCGRAPATVNSPRRPRATSRRRLRYESYTGRERQTLGDDHRRRTPPHYYRRHQRRRLFVREVCVLRDTRLSLACENAR